MTDTELDGESVTVVGGGFGGLSSACYLADMGADVTLIEQHERLGGVAGVIEDDGYRFDTGPSWYLMPEVFERFFGHFDRRPEEYYELTRLDPHYRVFWKDGDRADVSDSRDQVRALFESYEDGAGAALDAYLADAKEAYEVGMEQFVYTDRNRFRDFIDTDVVKNARGLTLLGSMDDHVQEYVEHPKLRQLLEYTLVFLGGSPYNTPALYSMLSHVDLNLGVYYPEGGIHGVVDALADLGSELGVEYRTGEAVQSISGGSGRFDVETEVGRHTADRVVCNTNPAYTEKELLPPGARTQSPAEWETETYAPSAFLLYLGVEGDVEPLEHHTLILPTDWDDHFEAIFEDPRWPADPSYYVSVTSRTDPTVAPDDGHAIVVLVPIAPGLDDGPDVRASFREKVLEDLAEHTGVDLRDRIAVEHSACVSEFSEYFGAPGGTALGLAHTLKQTGPLRPSHRGGVDGLYYTGSYTTPGIGVPMCLISGEHTADVVAEDVGATGRERGLLSDVLGRLG